ncbi:ABC transporter substrate-binding protein [Patescibacteria group bacterium]|nr:ABC transporter substrate-binding protein [Patescibacteria group bacterium]MBU1473237.1 ABC transporter substrate-binding protein [Patescibacteria group bacterium]MBU2459493.1 ABC transporter substrate-binding protein [Patescibacteria group bacterium]MBU2544152.1 ABC transporter substrate-binding protein [Patescibacteria group bacterium]
MIVHRKTRFVFLLLSELARKYTRALVFGFIIGVLSSLIFWRLYPTIRSSWSTTAIRIGIVGEFTPSTLPLYIQRQISEGLTTLSPDSTALPSLAESWEATDSGKTYVFHLSTNYRWHDGKKVIAEDINYNIKSITFSTVDDHTLKVSLANPYSPLPALLSKPIFRSGLLGFGSNRIASIRLKGDKVQNLKIVPVEPQNGKTKIYRFFRTEALAILAYKLGAVDILEDISGSPSVTAWGSMRVEASVHYDKIVTIFFNVTNPLLKDKAIRQALAYAIPDLQEERAYSPISKTSWAYSDRSKKYNPDPEHAKILLKQNSLSSNVEQMTISTFAPYLNVAQKIANRWTEIGLPTNIRVENSIPGDYQMLLGTQEVPPDPDQYPFWHSTQRQTNITGYANVKIDKLLEDGRQEGNQEERKKIYADFQRYMTEDVPAIFLYYPASYTITRGR